MPAKKKPIPQEIVDAAPKERGGIQSLERAFAILEEVAQVAGLPSWVAAGGAALLAGLGALVAIIRRVTEVLPSARGMLPTPPEQPTTAREANLTRELSAARREFP